MGRQALRDLLAAAAREATETAHPFREILRNKPEIASHLTVEQITAIDCSEDYLGAAEEFRKKLLED